MIHRRSASAHLLPWQAHSNVFQTKDENTTGKDPMNSSWPGSPESFKSLIGGRRYHLMLRLPAVAGQFYAGTRKDLLREIEKCFLDSSRGPGALPEIGGKEGLKGVVVPHAGYMFSGAIAAHSYMEIAKNGLADVYIIIGPNHTGMGSGVSVYPSGKWRTPLGDVEISTEVVKKLSGGIIDVDESAHMYEHSAEVQIPFLQYMHGEKKFTIVPICMAMQDYETSKEVGNAIGDVIKESEEKIMVIASSDFSHVGFHYFEHPPSGKRVDEYAKEQDEKAIEAILNIDPKLLIERVEKYRISMCGYGCVASMLVAAKNLGAEKGILLKYGNSYEVIPSDSCVGYGAIAIY